MAHTRIPPLKSGDITSDRVAFRFNEVEPINKAFLMMVRQEKFDVSEMAIATYLQAKAYGKPLTLLPATMMGRFQHGTMFYNSERGTVTPENLPGRRVGVRAFSQTTGVWLRGILWKDYGLDLGTVKWVTFEDAHVRRIPRSARRRARRPWQGHDENAARRRARCGDLRRQHPKRSTAQKRHCRTRTAAKEWYKKHATVPVNHMVVVKSALAKSDPGAVREIFRMLQASKKAAGLPKPGAIDTIPFGFEAVKPALELMSSYALEMKIIPRRFSVEELFDDTTRAL